MILGAAIINFLTSDLKWLVTRIFTGMFWQLYFYAKGARLIHFLRVVILKHKVVLRKPSEIIIIRVGEVVPSRTLAFVHLYLDYNEIYNIYDKHMHPQPPF